jgi:phage host-nuclease inhibitor protein Gam
LNEESYETRKNQENTRNRAGGNKTGYPVLVRRYEIHHTNNHPDSNHSQQEVTMSEPEVTEEIFFEFDRLRADLSLKEIARLTEELEQANKVADEEIEFIQEYRAREIARIQKQIDWQARNLEAYARSTDTKTVRLPHGVLKLRQGRDKVEVEDKEAFMKLADAGLLRTVPESKQPDLARILGHIKGTGEIPAGVRYVPAQVNFSYKLVKKGEVEEDGDE